MRLVAKNISRSFIRGNGSSNIFYAVRPVDLELRASAVTEITGRSGSGKTTLINLLLGFYTPKWEIYFWMVQIFH